MPSNKEYLLYVLDLLSDVTNISYKAMMGEYVLYKDDVVIGGIYDNRFLIKPTKSLKEYNFELVIPYPTSKGLLLIESEDREEVKEIVLKAYKDLKK